MASEFLVIAATLLDLKAARLLPGVVDEDAEDLELLEARDLLFARLLQYRAYKEVSKVLAERMASAGRRVPRLTPLEPHLAAILPELVWDTTGERLAELAARVLAPKPPPVVGLAHLHGSAVSVRDAGGHYRQAPARRALGDVPVADGGHRAPRDRRPVPRAAGAVPRFAGRVRAGQPAGRADGALDGRARRRREVPRPHAGPSEFDSDFDDADDLPEEQPEEQAQNAQPGTEATA